MGIFKWKVKRRGTRKDKIAGSLTDCGYIRINVDGSGYYAHKLAWYITYGYLPKMIYHINKDRADNRIYNLSRYTLNCIERGFENHFKGVYRVGNKFESKIMYNYENHYLGRFNNAREAAQVYNAKIKELYKEKNGL